MTDRLLPRIYLVLRHINLTAQYHEDHGASFLISGQEYT